MQQYTTKEKINMGKPIIDSPAKRTLKDIINPIILALSSTEIKYKVIEENNYKLLDGHPVIYIANHYSAQDTPIMAKIVNKRSYILAGKQNLRPKDELFFNSCGCIWVDRKDKEDMKLSKLSMEAYLNNGYSLIVFPEGTWCMSDELLALNMKWGIIEVALNTNAQIVITDLEYNYDTRECHITYSKPFVPNELKSKKEWIMYVRNTLASLKWEYMEQQGICERSQIDVEEMREKMRWNIREFAPLNENYERSVIYKPYEEPEDIFSHLKTLTPSKENAFLFNKHHVGMKK